MLRELALRDQHLTTSAQPPAAADRIDIHAETARRLQQRRAHGQISALARGREDNEGIACGHGTRGSLRRPPAMHALMTSTCIGLVIAEVMPAPMAMVRNALLMPSRYGRPKLMFEAPHDVLTLSSVRSRCTRRMT